MTTDPVLNPWFYTSPIASPSDLWYTNTLTTSTLLAPKIEENNPEELKINVKKHQIKFNFAL